MPAWPRCTPVLIALPLLVLAAGWPAVAEEVLPTSRRPDILDPVEEEISRLESRLPHARDPLERSRLLLALGRHEEALSSVPALLERGGLDARLLAARLHLATALLGDFRRDLEALQAADGEHLEVQELHFRWLLLRGDQSGLERLLQEGSPARQGPLHRHLRALAAGELALATRDLEGAEAAFSDLLLRLEGSAGAARVRARALHGLARVSYRGQDFATSLDRLRRALALHPLDPDLLADLAATLHRLGRIDEAISCAEAAVRLAPYHERGHSLLGGGHARRSYSELREACPRAFADRDGREQLCRADRLAAAGSPTLARFHYGILLNLHPEWADVSVRLGSLAYRQGEFTTARNHFRRALDACPDYGRAHEGLARSLEAERMSFEVGHGGREARFARTPARLVPGIEDYVTGWQSLSPRHRKQVGLSLAAWKPWIPRLAGAGASLTVQPLHRLLSEAPGLASLRGRRREDSLLWDDLAKPGGRYAVVGLEAVERAVHGRPDALLHAAGHQVWALLPATVRDRVRALCRQTGQTDEPAAAAGRAVECFARGAEALAHPSRASSPAPRPRAVRLEAREPELAALLGRLRAEPPAETAETLAWEEAELGPDCPFWRVWEGS